MSASSLLHRISPRITSGLCALALLCGGAALHAQLPASSGNGDSSGAPLPDSPGATLRLAHWEVASSSSNSEVPASDTDPDPYVDHPAPSAAGTTALRTHKVVLPGQIAPTLTSGDKFRLGFYSVASPFSALGWISSAAYSQGLDSAPNYGQGWSPFAQRLGAAAVRGASEELFSTSVFAPIFHEDPRVYVLGRGHPPLKRLRYAVTRPFVTRSDSGRPTPNFALITGNAAGAVLTNAYYPDRNRTASVTVETFAGAIGGAALGFVLREFLADALGIVHLGSIE